MIFDSTKWRPLYNLAIGEACGGLLLLPPALAPPLSELTIQGRHRQRTHPLLTDQPDEIRRLGSEFRDFKSRSSRVDLRSTWRKAYGKASGKAFGGVADHHPIPGVYESVTPVGRIGGEDMPDLSRYVHPENFLPQKGAVKRHPLQTKGIANRYPLHRVHPVPKGRISNRTLTAEDRVSNAPLGRISDRTKARTKFVCATRRHLET